MVQVLEQQLESAPGGDEPLVVELTTLRGGAELGHWAMLAWSRRANGWRRAGWCSTARRPSTPLATVGGGGAGPGRGDCMIGSGAHRAHAR